MNGLTLVAGYGSKPRTFEELVRELQTRLTALLGDAFEPYSVHQVHGTIIGFEGIREADRLLNTNFLQLRGERRLMNIDRALAVLDARALPLRIRVGGFGASSDYPFTSRGQHPYERSFSLQGDVAMVIGWPASGDAFPPDLDDLRRKFGRANVLHKYHASASDVDNDFYCVLGRIDRLRIGEGPLDRAELAIRRHLSERSAVTVELERQHLSLVAYDDPMLPLKGSRAFPLRDALNRLEEIMALY